MGYCLDNDGGGGDNMYINTQLKRFNHYRIFISLVVLRMNSIEFHINI